MPLEEVPDLRPLLTLVQDLVQTQWTNPLLRRRSTYHSSEPSRDLFPTAPPRVAVAGIQSFLCLYDETDNTDSVHTLQDGLTRFVTRSVFGPQDRLRLLYLVTNVYATFCSSVRAQLGSDVPDTALRLVLKGGLALRMNVLEMIRNLSSATQDALLSYLQPEIQLSDIDVELVSHPAHIPAPAVAKINLLSFVVLQYVRTHLVDHADYYFTFCRYSRAYQQKLLDGFRLDLQALVVDDMVVVEAVELYPITPTTDDGPVLATRDATTFDATHYTRLAAHHRPDFAVVPSASHTGRGPCEPVISFVSARQLLRAYGIHGPGSSPRPPRTALYVTHNPYITFVTGADEMKEETKTDTHRRVCMEHRTSSSPAVVDRIAFQLNRIKLSCLLYLQFPDGRRVAQRIAGEVLDVSHGVDTDTKRTCSVCQTHQPWYVMRTVIRSDPVFDLWLWTPYKQYHDLYFMLFKQTRYPWMLAKHQKRTRRLVAILLLYLLSARVSQQYVEWSARSFRDRVGRLHAVLGWFGEMDSGPFQEIPLLPDLLRGIQTLCTTSPSPECHVFVRTIRETWQALTQLLVRDCCSADRRHLTHRSHDPRALD